MAALKDLPQDASQRITITTVDPVNGVVQGIIKDGGLLSIATWSRGPLFIWPKEGEHWNIARKGNYWMLDSPVYDGSSFSVSDLLPGQGIFNAERLYDRNGNEIAAVPGPIGEGQSIIRHAGKWQPSTVVTTGGVADGLGLVLDGSAIDVGTSASIDADANTIFVKDLGITTAKLAAGAVTAAKIAASVKPPSAGGTALTTDLALRALGTGSNDAAAGNDSRLLAAIQTSLIGNKGDLIAGSSASTIGILPVGTNGQILTADSTQPLGLSWVTPFSGGGGGTASGDISGTYPGPMSAVRLTGKTNLDDKGSLVPISSTNVQLRSNYDPVNDLLRNTGSPGWAVSAGDGASDRLGFYRAAATASISPPYTLLGSLSNGGIFNVAGYQVSGNALASRHLADSGAFVTTIPTAGLVDGQEVVYYNATLNVTWRFKYRAGSSSTYKWEYIGGTSAEAEADSDVRRNTNNFAYRDPDVLVSGSGGLTGPAMTIPLAGEYLIEFGANIYFPTTNPYDIAAGVNFQVGTSTNPATVDANAALTLAPVAWIDTQTGSAPATTNYTPQSNLSRARKVTITTANTPITLKYLVVTSTGSAFQADYRFRWLKITPQRVTG